MKENTIRYIELGLAMLGCYMAAVTMVQTALFALLEERIIGVVKQTFLLPYMQFFDLLVIILALFTCFSFWRRGDEVWFGRLFSLNMLMFFPAVLDQSTFNWIGLILDYQVEVEISQLWVFMVGLILMINYLTLRYTVRFRYLRGELETRGAVIEDIDQVSGGQMGFLTLLIVGTAFFTSGVFIFAPIMSSYAEPTFENLSSSHILIGFMCVLWLAASIIMYLRNTGRITIGEPQQSTE